MGDLSLRKKRKKGESAETKEKTHKKLRKQNKQGAAEDAHEISQCPCGLTQEQLASAQIGVFALCPAPYADDTFNSDGNRKICGRTFGAHPREQLAQPAPAPQVGQSIHYFPNPYDTIASGTREGNFLRWDVPLTHFHKTDMIMIRECYERIYESIFRDLNGPLNIQNILVTGVPGIGKSYFCLYFLWRYIRENSDSSILLESDFEHVAHLDPSRSYITSRLGCVNMQYPYLVDFAAIQEPSSLFGSFRIVFSSPNPGRYHNMMKDSAQTYIMPTWNFEELMQLNEVYAHFPMKNLALSQDEIYQRFDLLGGVPRYIFSSNYQFVLVKLEEALSAKGGDIAEHFFTRGFGMNDEKMSHLLIHQHPDPEIAGGKIYTFASHSIWKKLYSRHQQMILMKSQNYFNAGPHAYGGGSFTGYHFELMCLDVLPIAGTKRRITPLTRTNVACTLRIPSSQKLDFKRDRQIVLQQNILYIPTKKNFESGDAFFLSTKNELFVLQVTVGKYHPVKAHGLEEIRKLFRGIPIKQYHLVFVVPARGELNSSQNITTMKGEIFSQRNDVVKSFVKNQWRLEYVLAVPNTEVVDQT